MAHARSVQGVAGAETSGRGANARPSAADAVDWCQGKCSADLVAAHVAPTARLERAQLEQSQPDALEPGHLVADGLEQTPHFAIPALRQLERQVRLSP